MGKRNELNEMNNYMSKNLPNYLYTYSPFKYFRYVTLTTTRKSFLRCILHDPINFKIEKRN